MCACCGRFNFAVGIFLAGLAGVLAAGQIGLNPNMGDDLLMPSFIAIIVGGVGSLTGTLLGGLLIGVASALTTVFLPSAQEAVIYVIMARGAADPPARIDGRRRDADMSEPATSNSAQRPRRQRAVGRNDRRLAPAIIWVGAAQRAAAGCRWSAATPRSPRTCWCMGLVAMSLNFLLGFTGVMSFGHAAYFGLGAYGAGLTLRYCRDSTWLAMLDGILLGGIAGTLLGTLIVRRRGVYFAMVTIAFGQVFYYIAYHMDSFTGGYDGLRGFSASRSTSARAPSTSRATARCSTTSCCSCSPSRRR